MDCNQSISAQLMPRAQHCDHSLPLSRVTSQSIEEKRFKLTVCSILWNNLSSLILYDNVVQLKQLTNETITTRTYFLLWSSQNSTLLTNCKWEIGICLARAQSMLKKLILVWLQQLISCSKVAHSSCWQLSFSRF